MKTKYQLTLALFILCIFTSFTQSPFENQETGPTIIELLENGESYSIEITSVGCFNGTRQTMRVSKAEDVFTVSFQDVTKTLSEQDIKAFVTFENQLRTLEMGGCSTVDTYVVRFRGEEFRTSDGTCSWRGGQKLLKAIS